MAYCRYMKISNLNNHKILRLTVDVANEYMAKREPKNLAFDPSLATRRESYAIETLFSTGRVITCFEQLHYSIGMLSGYRSGMPNRMNRHNYIVFGIENYYLRLCSAFDRCLRLSNVIYQLGLPERQCKPNTIIENSHLKGTSVARTLKEINKFTYPFRKWRNIIAHADSYSEDELHWLFPYYYFIEENDSLEQYKHLFKMKADNFVKAKKAEFKTIVEKLEKLVDKYLNALLEVFKTKLKSCC